MIKLNNAAIIAIINDYTCTELNKTQLKRINY